MTRLICCCLCLSWGLWACQSKPPLTVAVAANLSLAMEQVGDAFATETGIPVDISSASSGVLTAQIRNQAPFDLFVSANAQYPQALYEEGFTAGPPVELVRGQLVFWSQKAIAATAIDSLLLAPSFLSKVAIANPELAPYGHQARQWLESQELWPRLEARIVYGENVGQVNQYIYGGLVNAAFTARSAMQAPGLRDQGYWTLLSEAEQAGIPHSAVLLRQPSPEAQQLMAFLQGPQARAIFERHGYLVPSPSNKTP